MDVGSEFAVRVLNSKLWSPPPSRHCHATLGALATFEGLTFWEIIREYTSVRGDGQDAAVRQGDAIRWSYGSTPALSVCKHVQAHHMHTSSEARMDGFSTLCTLRCYCYGITSLSKSCAVRCLLLLYLSTLQAALNMATKGISIELRRRRVWAFSYHPGTTDTGLSKPFQANVKPEKLFTTKYTVKQLLGMVDSMKEELTGGFYAFDGSRIEW